jgi:hypothetical protein
VSRVDDAIGHRQTKRTPGGDAGPESIANPSKQSKIRKAGASPLFCFLQERHRWFRYRSPAGNFIES